MSLLLLFHGAAAAAAAPSEGWRGQFQTVVRRAGLTAAVVATLQPVWPPQAPAVAAQYGVWTQTTVYNPAKRPVELLNGWDWTPQEPSVAAVVYPPASQWQGPVAATRRSPELLGKVVWAARVVDVEYQEGWRSQFSTPPKPAQRSYGLLGWTVASPQQAPPFFQVYQEGWRQEFSKPVRLQPQPRLEGSIVSGRVPDVEYQDGWRSRFTDPPANLAARRSTKLLEGWDWPGYGYSFAVVVQTPTELWWGRWQDPPKAPARSVGLLGQAIWPPQVPTAAVSYGIVDLQHRYDPARRSVDLLGQSVTWGPRVPDREYQDGWRNLWQGPPALLGRRRATNLLESWPWPGYGYFFTAVVPTPSELWQPRWQDPTKPPPRSVGLLGQPIWPPNTPPAVAAANYGVWTQTDLYSPAKRSPSLLGQVSTWPPQAPSVVVAPPSDWWARQWPNPTLAARRSPALLGNIAYAVYPFVQVQVVYQEGWRSQFSQPRKIWQPWRLQGFVSYAAGQGLPVATPSALWMPSWQQWPREHLRSIALRQSAWAAWDPQFIIQITPPTPLEGVTFTFGLKRGASVSPGTKEGATMTGQRKTGGATLITRVKPRNS